MTSCTLQRYALESFRVPQHLQKSNSLNAVRRRQHAYFCHTLSQGLRMLKSLLQRPPSFDLQLLHLRMQNERALRPLLPGAERSVAPPQPRPRDRVASACEACRKRKTKCNGGRAELGQEGVRPICFEVRSGFTDRGVSTLTEC